LTKFTIAVINGTEAILIDEKGRKIATKADPSWEVGMEITGEQYAQAKRDALPDYVKNSKKKRPLRAKKPEDKKRFRRSFLIFLIMLLIALIVWVPKIKVLYKVDTYIDVAINPICRIPLNPDGRVLKMTGIDEESTRLVKGEDNTVLDFKSSVILVFDEAIEAGLLDPSAGNTDILLTIYNDDQTKAATMAEELREYALTELADRGVAATIYTQTKTLGEADAVWQAAVARTEAGQTGLEAYGFVK